MEIKIENYLSEDTIKQMCIEAITALLYDDASRERLLSNVAYKFAEQIISGAMTKDEIEQVRAKTREVISCMTTYNIFRKKDFYEKEESLGQKYLDQAVEEFRPTIKQKVLAIIEAIDLQPVVENVIESCVKDVIVEKLTTPAAKLTQMAQK